MADSQTLLVRPPIGAILAAVVIGGVFYLGGKHIETRIDDRALITVSGEGKTSVAPDIAELSFGLQTGRQATAKQAMEMLKKNMDAVIAAVKKAGVADKDLTTEQFSLNPTYDWTSGRQNIIGYEASQSLRAKVRNLDKVSEVLGAASGAGANQAGNVQFTVDDPEGARSEARAKAIVQAKEKAKKLANDLGMSLGKIRNFSEGGGYSPQPPIMLRSESAMGGAVAMDSSANQVALPAGEQDLTVSVSITYELR